MKQIKSHVLNVKKSGNKVIVTFKKGYDVYRATKDANNTWSGCKLNKAGRNCGNIWNIKYEYNPDMSNKFDNLIEFVNAAK